MKSMFYKAKFESEAVGYVRSYGTLIPPDTYFPVPYLPFLTNSSDHQLRILFVFSQPGMHTFNALH